jgi:hypothetical protein
MRNLTFGQAKSTIARVLGVCDTDPRVAAYLNEAQERLLNRPNDPVGSFMRYRVCTDEDCLVWPRQIRTIKAGWICNQPVTFRSEWFEAIGYSEGGLGKLDNCSFSGHQLIDRGTVCSFANVTATTAEPRKIQAVASDPSDNGKTIHLRYVDEFSNRKYTNINGTIQEGENLTLSTSGVLTSSNVATNGLYHVVKAITNYPIRLYSWDVNSATQAALIAYYEPSETHPIYRSTFYPGLSDYHSDDDCTTSSVEILAKLQHVDVKVDNDPLVLGNLPGLKDMVQSILMKERHEHAMAADLAASAAFEIDGEIASYLGDGMLMAIKAPPTDTWGPAVMNCV